MRIMRYHGVLLIALSVCGLVFSDPASAAIYAPGDEVSGVEGEAFGWARGDEHSTYSGWDFFEGVLTGGGAPFTDNTPDAVGQFGTPGTVSNLSGGYIPASSGNVYSPFAALDFSAITRPGTTGGDFTRIVAQFRTFGSELETESILLSFDTGADGDLAPSAMLETGRQPFGGGGDQVEYMAIWDLNGSQDDYRIDFNAEASSMSLGEFHVDTMTSASAFQTPSVITAIPEPTSAAFLLVVGSVVILRRRRR